MPTNSSSPPFGFGLYARLVHRTFVDRQGPRLTASRVLRLARFVPVFFFTQLWNRFCLRLDDLLFPGYRSISVNEPIFVCGMPRCGTTLLHRVLAEDANTTSFRLWELLLAPSIVQRAFYRTLGRLDRALGGHVKRRVRAAFLRVSKDMQQYHRLDLWEAEEDDLSLMPYIASAFLLFPYPHFDLIRPLIRFDDELPEAARRTIMARYKGLVQRHLYVYGRDKRFLSKNPFMSSKVESIRQEFPDARVICNVRTPHEAIPSMLSLFRYMVGFFKSPTNTPEFVENNLEIADYFYAHPMERLPLAPDDRHAFVRYPDLTRNLKATVEALYERLGYEVAPDFREYLVALDAQSRQYRSKHTYSLEEFGLCAEDVAKRYAAVFEQFDFETGTPARETAEESVA